MPTSALRPLLLNPRLGTRTEDHRLCSPGAELQPTRRLGQKTENQRVHQRTLTSVDSPSTMKDILLSVRPDRDSFTTNVKKEQNKEKLKRNKSVNVSRCGDDAGSLWKTNTRTSCPAQQGMDLPSITTIITLTLQMVIFKSVIQKATFH